jgi:hypothetical protein
MEQDSGGKESIKDSVRHCIESTVSFSKMSRPELEKLVGELLRGEGKGRERLEELLEELRLRSRKGVDRFSELVRSEVHREFDAFSPTRRDEIGEFFERLVALVGEYFGPKRTQRSSAKKAPAKAPAKKAPAKAAAKKAAKAAPAKKAPAKKAPAKKAAAKKA